MNTEAKRVSCARLEYANDYEKERKVFPFNKDSIETNVPDGVMPGNYRIGSLRKSGYHVIYVGRVDFREDRGIKDRLIEHIGEFEGDLYFDYNSNNTPENAYLRECLDYHFWKNVEGKLENKIHPDVPNGLNLHCPICFYRKL